MRIHRAGTITAGITLILIGAACAAHIFTGILSFRLIFRCWPFILIGLGSEMLLSKTSPDRMRYDAGAVVLLILMFLFAAAMAGADVLLASPQFGLMF